VTLSLNHRANELADRLAAEADTLRVAVTTLPGGTRLIDCGSGALGGLEAGRQFAQICMGGLGWVSFAPVVLEGRWLSGLTVVTDRPALACLASQYAGWRLDRDDYFAMASGPGRALIRAEELYDDLAVDERGGTAVLCLETREPPPEPVVDYVAERAGVTVADLTLLFAPTASLAGSVQVAARVVETALHKLHELEFDVERVVSGFGSCPLPPVARTDPEAIGRTNDAVLYGGQVELAVDAPDEELEAIVPRMPASVSRDHGEPFGSVLERAGWDFYEIDPLLFSPAEVRLASVSSGRTFHAGGVDIDVLERSFGG
jgi:methenyltetrahydromethanopterin cyclohydrolase